MRARFCTGQITSAEQEAYGNLLAQLLKRSRDDLDFTVAQKTNFDTLFFKLSTIDGSCQSNRSILEGDRRWNRCRQSTEVARASLVRPLQLAGCIGNLADTYVPLIEISKLVRSS